MTQNKTFKPGQILKVRYQNGYPTPNVIKGEYIADDQFFLTLSNLQGEKKHIGKNQILSIEEVNKTENGLA